MLHFNHQWPYWLLLQIDSLPAQTELLADFQTFHNSRTTVSSQVARATEKSASAFELVPPSGSNENQQNRQNQQKSANSANQHTPANSLLVQPAVAAFPGAIQPSQGPASLPRAPASSLPGASQQSPRGQPAVSQSTSQNGIIHTHLDHVNMSQCTFSFYVICYLYWFGCVSFLSAVSFTFQLE